MVANVAVAAGFKTGLYRDHQHVLAFVVGHLPSVATPAMTVALAGLAHRTGKGWAHSEPIQSRSPTPLTAGRATVQLGAPVDESTGNTATHKEPGSDHSGSTVRRIVLPPTSPNNLTGRKG